MKKIFKYFSLPILSIGLLWSCDNLDVPITTQLTPDVFPQNSTFTLESKFSQVSFKLSFA